MKGPFRYLTLFFLTFAFLAAPATANAFDGVTGAAESKVEGCSGCGSGGTVHWYELSNVAKNLPPIPSRFDWDGQLRRTTENVSVLANLLTRRMMAPCRVSPNAPRCVLWHDRFNQSPSTSTGTWYEVHARYPGSSDRDFPAEIGVAWNVRVWRENPAKRRFELLFERRVGALNRKGAGTDPSESWFNKRYPTIDASDATWIWYQGGAFSRRFMYDANGMSAGPLVNRRYGRCKTRRNYANINQGAGRFDLSLQKNSSGKFTKTLKPVRRGRTQSDAPRPAPRGYFSCYWEGAQLGGNFFRWGRSSGTQEIVNKFSRNSYKYKVDGKTFRLKNGDSQFGTDRTPIRGRFTEGATSDTYSSNLSGVIGRGTREALQFDWKLQDGKPRVRFAGAGAPGLFYAVQIVRIDRGEMILPSVSRLSGVKRNTYWPGWPKPQHRNEAQFFRTFLLNPIKPSDYCPVDVCIDPRSQEEPGNSPDIDLDLTTVPQTVTMQPTDQTTEMNVQFDDRNPDRQFVVPIFRKIKHFTPQMEYNGCGGRPSYDGANYASYRPGTGQNRYGGLASYGLPKETSSCGAAISALDEVVFQEPLIWTDTLENGMLQQTALTTTWLKPTLESPCPALDVQKVFKNGNTPDWPSNPRECPSEVRFNAWDDLFTAQVKWQAYWTDGLESPLKKAAVIGPINNALLRCGSMPTVAKKLKDCAEPFSPFRQKKAQAHILLPKVDGETFPVRIKLQLQNMHGNSVLGATITPRRADSTAALTNVSDGPINMITGQAEMNYCDQGIPEGTTVKDANPPRADRFCQGYALKWRRVASNNQCRLTTPPPPALNKLPAQANLPSGAATRLSNLVTEIGTKAGPYRGTWATSTSPYYPPEGRSCTRAGGKPGYRVGWWDLVNTQDPSKTLRPGFNGKNSPVGPGFGKNNSGPAIDTATEGASNTEGTGWVAEFSFANNTGSWKMLADYEGFTNKVWWFKADTATDRAFVKVLAPRNSR